MRRQRGFAILPFLPMIGYAIAAAVVVGGIWWVIDTWTDGRAAIREIAAARKECDRADKAIADCVRRIKDEVASCERREQAALDAIKVQNKAVSDLEEAGKDARARAEAARRRADAMATSTIVERERLGALILAGNAAGNCPAGAALAEVRKGFKP